MTPARKLAPPPPASRTRAVEPLVSLRARADRLLLVADAATRSLREEADARREDVHAERDHWATARRRSADRLDASARELQADADELRWLASLGA